MSPDTFITTTFFYFIIILIVCCCFCGCCCVCIRHSCFYFFVKNRRSEIYLDGPIPSEKTSSIFSNDSENDIQEV